MFFNSVAQTMRERKRRRMKSMMSWTIVRKVSSGSLRTMVSGTQKKLSVKKTVRKKQLPNQNLLFLSLL